MCFNERKFEILVVVKIQKIGATKILTLAFYWSTVFANVHMFFFFGRIVKNHIYFLYVMQVLIYCIGFNLVFGFNYFQPI